MAGNEHVPGYEPMLAAYHRAFAPELRAMIGSLPLALGQTVLDMACGDGAYIPWLAEQVGPAGHVVAVDVAGAYLEIASDHALRSACSTPTEFVQASIDTLPFRAGSFDLCWCAQSLYSLPDPVQALNHLARVTKPGGVVAVLESDTLHHVIFPWPIEIELSTRAAELLALIEQSDTPQNFYVGRQLRKVFGDAGFDEVQIRTFATDRVAPLGADERTFFAEYLQRLARQVSRYFDGPHRRRFDSLVDPESSGYLLNDPLLTATCIDQVVWARKSPHEMSGKTIDRVQGR